MAARGRSLRDRIHDVQPDSLECHHQTVSRSRNPVVILAWVVFLLVRGLLLWFFVIPAIVLWLASLVAWPILRPFGVRVPVGFLYYSRWATYLLDAMLTRVTPIQNSPWPWHVDVRASRISTWGALLDPSLN